MFKTGITLVIEWLYTKETIKYLKKEWTKD